MPRTRSLLATLALVAVASFALAPVTADARPKRRSTTRTLNFEDDMVETSYLRPEVSEVRSLGSRTRSSLIRIRTDFFKEIIRSATQL